MLAWNKWNREGAREDEIDDNDCDELVSVISGERER